ncbi:hypothetical protein JKP88DRAFT_263431 [Tribonema minus]|uniref:Uncharacterized protein n=1 Tax=Tribonema minus TaxID=303371 RepID=A0A836CDS5_9STRA|nr:hypothetical protein JKP88DRAFT_263431 [Tribonema minus]
MRMNAMHALLDKVALVKDAGQYRAGSEPYKLLETKEIEDKIRLFWRECRYPENYLQGRQEAVADLRERDKLNNFWNVHMRTVEKGVRNPYHAGDLIVVLQAVPQKRALDKYVMSMGMVGRDAEGVMHIEGVDALNPVNTPRKPLVLQEEAGMDRLRVWRPAGYEWAIYHRDANLLSQTAMTEIVQVAPAWAQTKGRFPRHHKMGDFVTVSAEERLLLVPTHTLTPLVLPKGAQVRFALAAGDKWTHFGTVVEDFVAASEKLFVNHLDAVNPYVWVRDNDGGRTWQVPVSELDLRGDPWWSRPALPVAPFKGEGWNLWPGPTLAWLVENEEDTSVALSIKPARLRWGIPNYARKTGRTMTIEHVPFLKIYTNHRHWIDLPGLLPPALKVLIDKLGYFFDSPLGLLPLTLKELTLGSDFRQPLGTLPDGLELLDLSECHEFNEVLGRLPPALKLSMGRTDDGKSGSDSPTSLKHENFNGRMKFSASTNRGHCATDRESFYLHKFSMIFTGRDGMCSALSLVSMVSAALMLDLASARLRKAVVLPVYWYLSKWAALVPHGSKATLRRRGAMMSCVRVVSGSLWCRSCRCSSCTLLEACSASAKVATASSATTKPLWVLLVHGLSLAVPSQRLQCECYTADAAWCPDNALVAACSVSAKVASASSATTKPLGLPIVCALGLAVPSVHHLT